MSGLTICHKPAIHWLLSVYSPVGYPGLTMASKWPGQPARGGTSALGHGVSYDSETAIASAGMHMERASASFKGATPPIHACATSSMVRQ